MGGVCKRLKNAGAAVVQIPDGVLHQEGLPTWRPRALMTCAATVLAKLHIRAHVYLNLRLVNSEVTYKAGCKCLAPRNTAR